MIKTCKNCLQNFSTRRRGQIYCSKKCFFSNRPPCPEETKKKISESEKGKIITEEVRKRMSLGQIGKKHSLATRIKMSQSQKGHHTSYETRQKIAQSKLGAKSHFWKGGKNLEPYPMEWKRSLKRAIRERDHYMCQICNALQDDKGFHVHHIDYDKMNCDPENLILLCPSCHSKTNVIASRESWKQYFIQLKQIKKPNNY
jgi:hypothetical protein